MIFESKGNSRNMVETRRSSSSSKRPLSSPASPVSNGKRSKVKVRVRVRFSWRLNFIFSQVIYLFNFIVNESILIWGGGV